MNKHERIKFAEQLVLQITDKTKNKKDILDIVTTINAAIGYLMSGDIDKQKAIIDDISKVSKQMLLFSNNNSEWDRYGSL